MTNKVTNQVNLEVGNVLRGIVQHITPFGAFVRLPNGKDGLLHISQMSDKFVDKVESVLNKGKKVDVKIISIEEDGKMKLTMIDVPKSEQGKKEDFEKMMKIYLIQSKDRNEEIRKNEERKISGNKKTLKKR